MCKKKKKKPIKKLLSNYLNNRLGILHKILQKDNLTFESVSSIMLHVLSLKFIERQKTSKNCPQKFNGQEFFYEQKKKGRKR